MAFIYNSSTYKIVFKILWKTLSNIVLKLLDKLSIVANSNHKFACYHHWSSKHLVKFLASASQCLACS